MTSKNDVGRKFIAKAKRMLAAENLPEKLPNGDIGEALGAKSVLLLLDAKGRVHQIKNANISDGTLIRIRQPRVEIAKLLDRFGVVDFMDTNDDR